MDETRIKSAFEKVRKDMDFLKNEVDFIKNQLFELEKHLKNTQTHPPMTQTIPTHSSTDNSGFKPLKHENSMISTGNQGVPTDRQTDRQTDRHTQIQRKNTQNSFEDALRVLDSLDSVKKEIRLKFKRLTDQEFLVFSTIYQLNEELEEVDYKKVAEILYLTESSIRDYVGKLIRKGIPVEKKKINNKNITLTISENLMKIAPLSVILQLREI